MRPFNPDQDMDLLSKLAYYITGKQEPIVTGMPGMVRFPISRMGGPAELSAIRNMEIIGNRGALKSGGHVPTPERAMQGLAASKDFPIQGEAVRDAILRNAIEAKDQIPGNAFINPLRNQSVRDVINKESARPHEMERLIELLRTTILGTGGN